jgi:hypothetical protein
MMYEELAWFCWGDWHSLAKCPSCPQLKHAVDHPPFTWAMHPKKQFPLLHPCPCHVEAQVCSRSIGTVTLFIHRGALLEVIGLLFLEGGNRFH